MYIMIRKPWNFHTRKLWYLVIANAIERIRCVKNSYNCIPLSFPLKTQRFKKWPSGRIIHLRQAIVQCFTKALINRIFSHYYLHNAHSLKCLDSDLVYSSSTLLELQHNWVSPAFTSIFHSYYLFKVFRLVNRLLMENVFNTLYVF